MFQVTGCSHRTGHVDVRERLALNGEQTTVFLQSFRNRFPEAEAVLLSTCNRTEFYAASRQDWGVPSLDEMKLLLAEFCDLNAAEIDRNLFGFREYQAMFHLLSVASSLDSLVIGETEILGQVRQAYRLASQCQPGMNVTHRIFQRAIHVARRVARETGIHTHRVSVPSLAIGGLALQTLGQLHDKTVLVIGAGEMANKSMKYLHGLGAGRLVVANRNLAPARVLANRYAATAIEWKVLLEQLISADLVVSATGSNLPVVSTDSFQQILSSRSSRPLVILDLAMPRDFEPTIGCHRNVHLFSIDDLLGLSSMNLKKRRCWLPAAREIVKQETAKLLAEVNTRCSIGYADSASTETMGIVFT